MQCGCLNRFQLHPSDNETSFQRRWGTAYSNPVLPFGELVLVQDQTLATWLGKCEATDAHIFAKANSNNLVKSNLVTRLSLDRSRDLTMFQSISLPPPEPPSVAYLKMAELGDQTSDQPGGAKELRLVYPPQASKQPQQKVKRTHKQQTTSDSTSAEAELYALGMAVHHSLHLKSLLQEMQLVQLAKPFELSVFTDSSSGKALASQLGLTKKHKHIQLRYVFMKDLLVHGQLQLRKIPAGKNPAAVLTTHLPASTLHKLLPRLGVRTRAADSKDLLSVLNVEMLASSREEQSFFIGMMAEQPVPAQLVASSVASLPSTSLSEPTQAAVLSLQPTQRTFSLSSF